MGRRVHPRVVDVAGVAVGPQVQVFRADQTRYDPYFLACFLMAAGMARGSSTSSRADVRRTAVPRLPIEEQRACGAAHRRLAELSAALRELAAAGDDTIALGIEDSVAAGSAGRLNGGVTTIVSRYQLDPVHIGKGGMGEVWGATDTRLRRRVAVKFVRFGDEPELIRRFVRESQLTARMGHPGVPVLYDADRVTGGPSTGASTSSWNWWTASTSTTWSPNMIRCLSAGPQRSPRRSAPSSAMRTRSRSSTAT